MHCIRPDSETAISRHPHTSPSDHALPSIQAPSMPWQDLAIGHVKAIHYIFTKPGLDIINLGTGRGYSVLEMAKAFGEACGKEIP